MGDESTDPFPSHSAVVEVKTPLSLQPGAEKERFVVCPPAQSQYYTGVANCDRSIQPGQTGATWYPHAPPMGSSEKPGYVVLHFHGGAYVIGDGRTEDAGFAAKTLLANTSASYVFAPQYRLASNPGGRFPAALQDAITAYTYLVFNRGIHPSKIILSGDSAGANLCIALLRYISDHGTRLGLLSPGAAWLWSPWANPGYSHNNPAALDNNPNAKYDYIVGAFGGWGARCFAPEPSTGLDIWNENISFVGHPFKTETPLWITAGEYEVLLPEIRVFEEEMRSVNGHSVSLDLQDYAVHDIILVGHLVSFEQEAAAAAKRAGRWLDSIKR